ncbi:YidC/Oxa1 family membrane protein insertase [Marinitenerispora sediminis]|uniref:Membrane protein insertase YidC n=1 Tax=Marinitenerispora sediminis TaxID=1931232 RepID=A0A368T2V2_9ACTN|nr:YidC/Oxa1 family membrane protein insertase [Marinitenerispora sediminis]RCV48872.1 insertase [Marinitenerispora sediminis]RCV50844.1 insertase [Marinitenerispora sediminis]RCV57290.1 insertase [Marinitenerispora sediminis]
MYSFPPIAAAIGLAHTVVTGLTGFFEPMLAASAAAVAVVTLTALVRLAVLPLNYAQVRGEKARARIMPRLMAVREEHGDDPQRLTAEMQKVYTEEGVSPLAGCLPMLAQTPVFIALYGLFITPEIGGEPNSLLTRTLGGVPLGATLPDAFAAGGQGPVVFAVLLAVIALVAWASRQWLTLPQLRQNAAAGQPAVPGLGVIAYLPFITVAIAAFVPLAAGLYLAASTAWTVAERLVLRRVIPD